MKYEIKLFEAKLHALNHLKNILQNCKKFSQYADAYFKLFWLMLADN